MHPSTNLNQSKEKFIETESKVKATQSQRKEDVNFFLMGADSI